MTKKTILSLLLTTVFIASNVFADDKVVTNNSDANSKISQVVDEYKNYLSTISTTLRAEIVNYHKEVAKLNKQKRDLYSSLSQEAQGYLAKTQEFKKKLPIRQRGLINIDNPGEKVNSQNNNNDHKNSTATK